MCFVQHRGSFCFTDPDEKLGYAYAMDKHGFGMANERRELALRKALIQLPLKKMKIRKNIWEYFYIVGFLAMNSGINIKYSTVQIKRVIFLF